MRRLVLGVFVAAFVLAATVGLAPPAEATCGHCVHVYYGSEWQWTCWNYGDNWWCSAQFDACIDGTGGC